MSQPMIWVWTALSTDPRRMLDMLNGAEPRSYREALVLVNGFRIDLLIGLVRAGSDRRNADCEST
jgi:hypothetical protein